MKGCHKEKAKPEVAGPKALRGGGRETGARDKTLPGGGVQVWCWLTFKAEQG